MSDELNAQDAAVQSAETPVKRVRVATVWLDGCSGCHMSLLDMDERIIELARHIEVVCSPYIDLKEFPDDIDLALVEGAVSSEEDLHKIRELRKRTKVLISLGDCAVTGNVPAMRNGFPIDELMERAYLETATEPLTGSVHWYPSRFVPALRTHSSPVHEVVEVDLFVPGCPPPADAIHFVLTELLAGRRPNVSSLTRFGR